MHEFDLINKHFLRLSKKNKSSLNLNDDVFFDKLKELIVSVDTYVDGVHFVDFKKPHLVIKKILRSSISDLICKGVEPKYYFISGSGNKKVFTKASLIKISESLKQEQKKFNIHLCGGDTVKSNKLSFTITSIGFSKKIIFRNHAKKNDDIFVTGNLGDSYAGLLMLKKRIHIKKNLMKYFYYKYFHPDLHLKIAKKLLLFANTSIDVSDGLVSDLEKLINKQKLSYKLNIKDVPISNNLKKILKSKKFKKINFISKGDDYQILFTANPSKHRIINKIAKSLNIKISKIGKICSQNQKSQIIDENGNNIDLNNKGYYHTF
tara:strand:- start:1912 stop:2871 length:960 start_codon:yes stop_codon:yes gene_type:complete